MKTPFKFIIGLIALTAFLSFNACKRDDATAEQTAVTLSLTDPSGIENVTIKDIQIQFKEVNSGTLKTINEVAANNQATLSLDQGAYEVSVEGSIEYTQNGDTYTSKVKGFSEGVTVVGSAATVSIPLYLYAENAGFVIKEIFFTGTRTPEDKAYNGDKYFVLYNNSDSTLFADGLVLAQSSFLTTTKQDYTPDIMSEAFTTGTTIDGVVMIPGSGTTYPVEPGQSIVIANNAINHLEYNANSLDLSKADFELELIPSINVDNPAVPNLINITGAMTMHDRGFKSYVLARLPEDMTTDTFKEQNQYSYSYTTAIGTQKTQNAYKIPNEWIIDAVNLSVEDEFSWIVTAPSLDMGWTYCGKTSSDKNRYGKSVRRIVLSTAENGREILKDTNNSTKDFLPETTPSLKEGN